MKFFIVGLLCVSSIFQLEAYPMTGNGIYDNPNVNVNIDPFVGLATLPDLIGKLNPEPRTSLLEILRNSLSLTSEEITSELSQWYYQQDSTTQLEVMSWVVDLMKANQIAQRKNMEVLNENSISPEVKAAWERFQQLTKNADVIGLEEYTNSLPQSVSEELDYVFTQVYGKTPDQILLDISIPVRK